MTTKTTKSVLTVPDDYIPRDNNDLVAKYESFVALLVRRYNRVDTNFKDLLQHVWMKLFEVRIIEKYKASGVSLPKVLTGPQAAAYLQMTWPNFKTAIWRHQLGDYRHVGGVKAKGDQLKKITAAVFERDRGICSKCGKNCPEIEAAFNVFKTTGTYEEKRAILLRNHGIPVGRDTFWIVSRKSGTSEKSLDVADMTTVCLFCCPRSKSPWAPTSTNGKGYGSRKATYSREDLDKFKALRSESKRTKVKEVEEILPSQARSFFKLYLARAVHNIYANWCRTRSRRYKEIYLAPTEDGQAWESFLEDPRGGRQEDIVSLYHAVKLITSGEEDIRDVDLTSKDNQAKEVQFLSLIAEGYSLTEVVQKLSLPKSVLRVIER